MEVNEPAKALDNVKVFYSNLHDGHNKVVIVRTSSSTAQTICRSIGGAFVARMTTFSTSSVFRCWCTGAQGEFALV